MAHHTGSIGFLTGGGQHSLVAHNGPGFRILVEAVLELDRFLTDVSYGMVVCVIGELDQVLDVGMLGGSIEFHVLVFVVHRSDLPTLTMGGLTQGGALLLCLDLLYETPLFHGQRSIPFHRCFLRSFLSIILALPCPFRNTLGYQNILGSLSCDILIYDSLDISAMRRIK